MNYIAFDLGGSGGKIILATHQDNSLQLTTIHRFEHTPVSLGKSLYWDILAIYKELVTGITIAIEAVKDSITSLGIDSFCNDFVLLSPNGELISQMHCYRDARTIRTADQIYAIMEPKELYWGTGNQLAPFNTLMQLAAMNLEESGSLLKHSKLLFLPDFLLYTLSGRMVTEYTLASVSQMFDPKTNFWNTEILANYNIPQTLFAEIVKPGVKIGETSNDFNTAHNTKGFSLISVCEHDTASAFLASAGGADSVIISCGTWALVGTETYAPIINTFGYQNNIANEGGYPGMHHRILKNVMGTWIIQEIKSYYHSRGKEYSYGELETMAGEADEDTYFIDVDDPVFYSPGNMVKKIEQYCLENHHDRPLGTGNIIRIIYENLAFKFCYNIKLLAAHTGKTFKVINLLGGGAKSALLCQLTANICNLPVIAGPVEATALGNVLVQMISANAIATVEEGRDLIRKNFATRQYLPVTPHIWAEKYQNYIRFIIQKTKERR